MIGREGTRIHGYDITNSQGITTATRRWFVKYRLMFYGLSVLWLLPIIVRSDFLYIFLPGRLGVMAALLAIIMRRPYGIYLRGSRIDLFGVAFSLSRAAFVLAAGPFLRDVAARYCDTCDVVSPMFDIGAADLQLNRVQRIRSDKWRLLYVGTLEEAKGTLELLDAVEILRQRGRAVELDLVGNWVDAQLGRKVETEKGLYCAARFSGAIDDRSRIRTYFLDSDLFVFPSHSEGFPRVLYEAMCFGLPIVTTMVDGIPSVMQAGVNCLAVPVGDASALADAIDQALEDVTLREKLAAGGLSTMRNIFAENKKSHAEQVIERVRRVSAKARIGAGREET
jgi:glycosyltransferase involved in cell wall biosynthesis